MIPESTAPAAAAPSAEMGGRGLLARRASVVSAAVLASRVLGVVREQVFAVLFGAGRELDAFITAFRIPNLLRDLFAEGALSAAFVSTFTKYLERGGEAAAWRLASLVINALAVVVGVPAAAAAFFNVGSIVGGLATAYWMAPAYVHGILGAVVTHARAPNDPAQAARAITGMAIGTLVGGLLQLLVQVPSLGRVGF